MPGLGKQAAKKGRDRSVPMDMAGNDAAPAWSPPPLEECEEITVTSTPVGADRAEDQIITRMAHDPVTWDLVDFAIIQQTFHRRRWRNVAKADSAHDVEVHVHRFARSGDPNDQEGRREEPLCTVSSVDDVLTGYQLACDAITGDWLANKRKWEDA